jgi:allantoin racemase
MHRILVVEPVATAIDIEALKETLNKHAYEDFQVDVTNIPYGSYAIGSSFDIHQNAPFIVRKISEAEKQDYDGVIINCFADPGLIPAREAVKIPVIGPGETSLHIALMLGTKFSIVSVGGLSVSKLILRKINELGIASSFASLRQIDLTLEEYFQKEGSWKDENKIKSLLTKEAKAAIKEDGADVIVLGCTGFTGLASELSKKLAVPVIDPLLVALRLCEALISLNISHSKLAYPEPPKIPASHSLFEV